MNGNRYLRMTWKDKRIARGDDFAGDAWYDVERNRLVYVVVGNDPNERGVVPPRIEMGLLKGEKLP